MELDGSFEKKKEREEEMRSSGIYKRRVSLG